MITVRYTLFLIEYYLAEYILKYNLFIPKCRMTINKLIASQGYSSYPPFVSLMRKCLPFKWWFVIFCFFQCFNYLLDYKYFM